MFEEQFSPWKAWGTHLEFRDIGQPGVYVIAKPEHNIADQSFSWRKDIIYIGVTNSAGGLRSRLRQFDRTVRFHNTSHGGAERVRHKYKNHQELISQLYVAVTRIDCDVTSNNPEDLRKMGSILRLEFQCFAEYAERFGYLPEFNDKKLSPKYTPACG